MSVSKKRLIVITLALLLVDCAQLLGLRPDTELNIKGQVLNDTYFSPSGRFQVKVPRLLQPGAFIRDKTNNYGNVSVFFGDDLCRFFSIEETHGPEPEEGRWEEIVKINENTRLSNLGISSVEPISVDTNYGSAVWFYYLHPAGAPCKKMEMGTQGKHMVNLDAVVDLVVLYAAGRYYRVLYVRAPNTANLVRGFTSSSGNVFQTFLDSLIVVLNKEAEVSKKLKD